MLFIFLTAAKSVNYWVGTTTLMPLVGRFVADAYTGGFNMVIFSSLVYLMVNPNFFNQCATCFYYNLVM